MRLVNWMMSEHTAAVSDLFSSSVDEHLVEELREVRLGTHLPLTILMSFQCLDTGSEFAYSPKDASVDVIHAFGKTLLRLLACLTDPVVPTSLHVRCVQVTSRDQAFEVRRSNYMTQFTEL
jgi:phosphatidylinositol-bisphosphatase